MTRIPDDRECLDLMDTINRGNLKASLRVVLADLKRTLGILAFHPYLIPAAARIHLHQKRAEQVRRKAKAEGRDVPVMMLISLTSRCNLSCSGCYMQQRKGRDEPEMRFGELMSVIAQAETLGISVISFVGGEPLLRRRDLFDIVRSFPRILFTLSTNGLLIDEDIAREIASCPNLVPFISLEGFRTATDTCRGQGVHDRVLAAFSLLERYVLFYGCAVTVSRKNIHEVLGDAFIREMVGSGVRAFIFIQYVPVVPGTDDLVPTAEERALLVSGMREFNRKYPAFFIGIPGEMEMFGGCLAGGRGFIHLSPCGDLEPCPIVPVSDSNVRTRPLKDALQSDLLDTIRRNHRSLHANGRCVLRTSPRWLEVLLSTK
jgi:MoaA/NifB/PqqE/SkfB family radical SAM enzyme